VPEPALPVETVAKPVLGPAAPAEALSPSTSAQAAAKTYQAVTLFMVALPLAMSPAYGENIEASIPRQGQTDF
jgi:hypothetical protein